MNKATFIFLFLIGLTAFLFRFFYLGHDQLWMDEAYSVIVSGQSFDEIVREIPGNGSPPLYNFLLHGWMEFFGSSEISVRSLSVLFGIGFILLLFVIGKSWFGTQAGLLAALIGAVNALHVFYSQQARVYSLLMLLSLLSVYFLQRLLRRDFVPPRNDKINFIGYTLITILLLYSHNWALFLLPVPYLFIVLNRASWSLFPKIIFSHLIAFLFYLPFIPSLITQAASGSSSWITYFWDKVGAEWGFLKTFEIFFMGGEFLTFGKIPYGRWLPIVFLIFILFFIFSSPKIKNKNLKLLLFYLLIPLLIPYLFSFYHPFYVPGRYDLIVFGPFCLLLAFCFSQMPKKVFIGSLTLFIFLSSVNLYGFYFKRSPRHENQAMALFLKENASPNDLIIFTGLTRLPIQYYLGEKFDSFQIKHHPADAEKTIGYYDYPKYLASNDAIEKETFDRLFQIKNEPRIWVCANRWLEFVFEKKADFMNEPLYFALTTHYQLAAIHPFRKAFILEFKPWRSPTSS